MCREQCISSERKRVVLLADWCVLYFTVRFMVFLFFVVIFFLPQTLFEPMFIAVYNVFYTSQPVLALGIFDQDVDEAHSLKYPRLYAPGLSSALFNKREFFKSALQGFIASCVLFFLSHGEPSFKHPQCLKITQKCLIFNFLIFAFFTNFGPIKIDQSGNTVWP